MTLHARVLTCSMSTWPVQLDPSILVACSREPSLLLSRLHDRRPSLWYTQTGQRERRQTGGSKDGTPSLAATAPDQLSVRRAAWGAVCRLQFHLTGNHAAGSVMVAARGHGASSTVRLGALACGMQHMYVQGPEDMLAFKAAVSQVGSCAQSCVRPITGMA